MDERSSRFVDTLVMEKLLTEKLEKVSHIPTKESTTIESNLFADKDTLAQAGEVLHEEECRLHLRSPHHCMHEENRTNYLLYHPAKERKATIILVHGLFEDSRELYGFLMDGLRELGYAVYQTTLPFHYERRPQESLFSGEYFWSAHLKRSRTAFKQAMYELYQTYNLIQERTGEPTYIVGFSMGGSVSLMSAALWPEMPPMYIINPAAGLSDIVWDSPLCQTIKADYLRAGFTLTQIQELYASFEPLSADTGTLNSERIHLAYALYDQVTEQYQYENLRERWGLTQVTTYKAGHLNTLRVPRLARDIETFFASTREREDEQNN